MQRHCHQVADWARKQSREISDVCTSKKKKLKPFSDVRCRTLFEVGHAADKERDRHGTVLSPWLVAAAPRGSLASPTLGDVTPLDAHSPGSAQRGAAGPHQSLRARSSAGGSGPLYHRSSLQHSAPLAAPGTFSVPTAPLPGTAPSCGGLRRGGAPSAIPCPASLSWPQGSPSGGGGGGLTAAPVCSPSARKPSRRPALHQARTGSSPRDSPGQSPAPGGCSLVPRGQWTAWHQKGRSREQRPGPGLAPWGGGNQAAWKTAGEGRKDTRGRG